MPYGNYGAEEIEDARIVNIGHRYEPQAKINGRWCVYSAYERAWLPSTSLSLRFWRKKKAMNFLRSNLISLFRQTGNTCYEEDKN